MNLSKRGIVTIAVIVTMLLVHSISVLCKELAFEKNAKEELMVEVLNLESELEAMHFDNQELQSQVEELQEEVNK